MTLVSTLCQFFVTVAIIVHIESTLGTRKVAIEADQ